MHIPDSIRMHRFARTCSNFWFSKKRDGAYLFLTATAACIYLAGLAAAEYELGSNWLSLSIWLKQVGFAFLLLTGLLFLIHWNLYGLHHFLHLFQQADHLPKKQISYVNSFCMTIFLSLSFFAAAVISPLLDSIWSLIYHWFQNRWHPITFEADVTEPLLPEAPAPESLLSMLGEAKPTPQWMKILEEIFFILVWILIAILLLFLIRSMLRAFWSWITRPRHFDSDEKIYLKPTLFLQTEGKQRSDVAQNSKRLLNYFSYNSRIRRRYRREILSRCQKQTLLSKAASPQELENTVHLQDLTLHELYEKARYADFPCTEEDWNRLI